MAKKVGTGHQYDQRERDILDKGRLRINDLIAPDSMKIEPNAIQIGNRYVRTLFVTVYPRNAHIGWLNRLYSFAENIDISIHIEPLNSEVVIKALNRKITQYISSQRMDADKGKLSDIAVDSARYDAEVLRDNLHNGLEKLFYQSIYITLAGSTEEEIEDITNDIETLCGTLGLSTRHATYQQEQGFITTLPLGTDRIGFKRNFDTSSLATCLPIVSAELTNTDGMPILYGLNMINGSLVIFDRFKQNNYNEVILATSGVGKSYYVKLESIRYMGLGVNIIIIDPQAEYRRLAENYGGAHVRLASNSKQKINPLDITKTDNDEENFLTSKILNVVSIVEVMIKRSLSARERKVLLDATTETYAAFGITQDKESLNDDSIFDDDDGFFQLSSGTKKMPILSDLEGTLRRKGEEAINLANELEPFTSGVLSIFNGETNVDVNSNLIVFDVKDMEKELADLAMFICLEFIWNKIEMNDGKKRILVIDEAWQLMKNPASANYIIKVAKTARKFNAGISIISQQVDDFLNYGGEGIIGNAAMQILLKQSSNDIKKLSTVLTLSNSEQSFLKSANIGEALIIVDKNRTLVKVLAHEFEHLLCDTTPENTKIIEQILKRG